MPHPNKGFSLEAYQSVSQEIAVLDRFSTIGNKVKDSVLGFISSARGFITMKQIDDNVKSLTFDTDKITKSPAGVYLDKLGYVNSREMSVFTPVGFVGSMTAYMDVLIQGQEYFAALERDVLDPSIKYLSAAIASPAKLGGAGAPAISPEFINKWASSISKYQHDSVSSDLGRFGDLYKSNTEFFDTYSKALVLNKYAGEITNVRTVRAKVKELAALFDRLMLKMAQSPEVYKVNGINAQGLTDLSYTLARSVELYATFISLANSALVAVQRTEEKFAKIAKEKQ